jgi:pimeloyl-ACP methyl ester carboxylesterase
MALEVRSYGDAGPLVVVVHGGPGAPGTIAPVARGLADVFRVIEPLQRGSGGAPLTVARHVADLQEVVQAHGGGDGERPAIVGHSWGAMLALAWAAAHPRDAGPLVIIGSGTFDRQARARYQAIVAARKTTPEPETRGEGLRALYDYDPISDDDAGLPFDERANRESWADMVRLQDEGVYPAAFAAIDSPVLMLHGAYDPHPGALIRDGLVPWLRRLEYREWEACGHSPWNERVVRDEFFAVLRGWLSRHAGRRASDS